MLQINPLLKKLFKSPTRSLLVVAAVVVVGFSIAQPAEAKFWDFFDGARDAVLIMMSWVLYFFMIYLMGKLATLATELLVYVAQYNNFTDLPVIIEAWSVVRDLANMFFIVILLVIAFGTLFKIEAYSWKKLLPKMVLAAVLVNYSRAICGFIVDASQIVMLTFVAAIKDAAAVGLSEAFNLGQLLDFGEVLGADDEKEFGPNVETRFVSIVAAGFMLMTMFTVQCVYIVVLVGRLVMIWFLTVLSPLAYVTSVLPQTERFARQWWEMFGRYVTVGPLCMFFLWLAMFIAAKSVDDGGLGKVSATSELAAVADEKSGGFLGTTGALDLDVLAGFVIATLMLMAGMKMALENSSEISEYTGKAAKIGTATAVVGGLWAATKFPGNVAIDAIQHRTGRDLNVSRQWKMYKHERELQKERRFAKGYAKASKRAVRGDWTSALGAAGYWGEHYAPLVGEMGFGHFLKRKFGSVQTKLNKKTVERDDLLQAQRDLDGSVSESNKAAAGGLIDEETKQNELKQLGYARASLDEVKDNGPIVDKDENQIYNADEEGGRAVLEEHQSILEERLAAAETAGDFGTAKTLTKQIAQVQAALQSRNEKAKIDITATDREAAINRAMAKNNTATTAMQGRSTLGGALKTAKELKRVLAEGTQAFEGDKGIKGADLSDLSGEVKGALDKLGDVQKKKTDNEGKIKELNKYIQDNRAPIDYELTNKQREVAQKTFKELVTDNEEYLMDEIKNRVHHGDITAALAVGEHMSKVGHDNEIPRAFGYAASPEGMKAWYDDMVKQGADEQWVLSVMQQICTNAQANNHWQMAQLVGVKDGKRYFRRPDEAAAARRIEAEKYGVDRLLQNGNRLGWGEYTDPDNENWQMLPEMASLLAENLHRLTKTIVDGRNNTNSAAHFATPKVDADMRKLIAAVQTDEKSRAQALANWERMISGVGKKAEEGSYGSGVSMSIKRAEEIMPRATAAEIKASSKAEH